MIALKIVLQPITALSGGKPPKEQKVLQPTIRDAIKYIYKKSAPKLGALFCKELQEHPSFVKAMKFR